MTDFSYVTDLLDEYVRQNKLPGCAIVIANRSETLCYFDNGLMDRERGKPMSRDTLFRIYSMSKPITSVALMQLWEASEVALDDPVSRFLPNWTDFSVFEAGTADDYTTVPASRDMKVIDLLRHTAGLTYGFEPENVVDQLYHLAGLNIERRRLTLKEGADKLAVQPLRFSPGDSWHYSFATDVVGHLVEVISGQPLDDYFQEHIFQPLDMSDTGFYVPPEDVDRFAACYSPGSESGQLELQDDPSTSSFLTPPGMLSGGGGLVSTIDDYLAFSQTMLAGGRYRDRQILKSDTVQLMTKNHLPNGQDLADMGQSVFCETSLEGIGFGLGYSVVMAPEKTGTLTSKGEFAWGGMASTFHWVDPVKDITVVFMTQLLPSDTYPIRMELKDAVYRSLG